MRALTVGLLASAAALGLVACNKADAPNEAKTAAAPAAAPEGSPLNPKRRPGLWEQTIAVEGQPKSLVIKLCLDEAVDAQMSVFGDQKSREACSENKITKTAEGYAFRATCDMGKAGVVTSEGRAVGDMSSSYTVDITSVTTGAAPGSTPQTSKMLMTAKWTGPCPAGMAPGMADVPGAGRIDMTQSLAKQDTAD
jgi:hypothetical protein